MNPIVWVKSAAAAPVVPVAPAENTTLVQADIRSCSERPPRSGETRSTNQTVEGNVGGPSGAAPSIPALWVADGSAQASTPVVMRHGNGATTGGRCRIIGGNTVDAGATYRSTGPVQGVDESLVPCTQGRAIGSNGRWETSGSGRSIGRQHRWLRQHQGRDPQTFTEPYLLARSAQQACAPSAQADKPNDRIWVAIRRARANATLGGMLP